MRDKERQTEVLRRLKRAAGQVAGVIRMVEDGRDCGDVIQQVKAVRTAMDAAGKLVLACHLEELVAEGKDTDGALSLLMNF